MGKIKSFATWLGSVVVQRPFFISKVSHLLQWIISYIICIHLTILLPVVIKGYMYPYVQWTWFQTILWWTIDLGVPLLFRYIHIQARIQQCLHPHIKSETKACAKKIVHLKLNNRIVCHKMKYMMLIPVLMYAVLGTYIMDISSTFVRICIIQMLVSQLIVDFGYGCCTHTAEVYTDWRYTKTDTMDNAIQNAVIYKDYFTDKGEYQDFFMDGEDT